MWINVGHIFPRIVLNNTVSTFLLSKFRQASDSATETPIGKHAVSHFQSTPCSFFILKEKLSCLPTVNIHDPVRNLKTYNAECFPMHSLP